MTQIDKAIIGEIGYSNNNLTVENIYTKWAYSGAFATEGKSSGKWYWEVTIDNRVNEHCAIGISTKKNGISAGSIFGVYSDDYSYRLSGTKINSYNSQNYGEPLYNGDTLGILLDLDDLNITFSRNGVIYEKAYDIVQDIYFPGFSFLDQAHKLTFNFGKSKFKYTMPDGYQAYDTVTYYLLESENKLYTIKNDQEEYILELLPEMTISNLSKDIFNTKGFTDLNYIDKYKDSLNAFRIHKYTGI